MKIKLIAIFILCYPLFLLGQESGSDKVFIFQNALNETYYYVSKQGKTLHRSLYNNEFSEGLAKVDNRGEINGRLGYIDENGNVKILLPEDFRWSGDFSDGLASAQVASGKWGYIDKRGKIFIKPLYDRAGPFSGGFAAVSARAKYGYIDTKGQVVIPIKYQTAAPFSAGMASVGKKSGTSISGRAKYSYGFINAQGKQVVEMVYQEVSALKNGYAWVGKKGSDYNVRYGLINNKGVLLTKLEFNNRFLPPKPPEFINGRTWTEIKTQSYLSDQVLIDSTGKKLKSISGARNMGSFHDGYALVVNDSDDSHYFVDESGEEVFGKRFHSAGNFSEGLAPVIISKGDKAGYIDIQGSQVIKPRFDWSGEFSDGIAPVKVDGKCGYIHKNGRYIVTPQYQSANAFSEGMGLVSKGDTFGYINQKGDVSVKPQFKAAESFKKGLAKVGTYPADATSSNWTYWYYIDKTGKTFWKPENTFHQQSLIILPPDYDKRKKYPVLVAFPFTNGTSAGYMSFYMGYPSNEHDGTKKLGKMLQEFYPTPHLRKNRSFILMITPGKGRDRDHSWQGFQDAISRYDNLLNRDLTLLEKKYSIDTSRIILSGFSLGGDLSWALALKNAGKYKGVIVSGTRCGYSDKGAMPILKSKKARFFLAMGENELQVRIKGMRGAKDLLNRNGVSFEYHVIPKIGHNTLPKKEFKKALEYVMFNQ